jgi:hypothetical protein
MNRFTFMAALAVASNPYAPFVYAETAHEHGAASLNIAIDASEVLMELGSPAVNIIGFEHPPGTDEQHQLLDQAAALLREPEQLFLLSPEAGCLATAADLESSLLAEHDEHAEESEHHKAHEKYADTAHEDEHDHKDEHETHSEFHALYTFSCAEPAELHAIELVLFQHFPGLEDVDVQFIGPSGQLGVELTPSQNRLEF